VQVNRLDDPVSTRGPRGQQRNLKIERFSLNQKPLERFTWTMLSSPFRSNGKRVQRSLEMMSKAAYLEPSKVAEARTIYQKREENLRVEQAGQTARCSCFPKMAYGMQR
jgi:hypothetical protein